MKQTGKAYLLTTKRWGDTTKYILVNTELTYSTYWTSSLHELGSSQPDKPQITLEQNIHQLLANNTHLRLIYEVDLPFNLNNYPELLI